MLLLSNRSKIIGKMNKNFSFTDGLSPSVLDYWDCAKSSLEITQDN